MLQNSTFLTNLFLDIILHFYEFLPMNVVLSNKLLDLDFPLMDYFFSFMDLVLLVVYEGW